MLEFPYPSLDSNRGGLVFSDQTQCGSLDISILSNEQAMISESLFEDEESVMSWIKQDKIGENEVSSSSSQPFGGLRLLYGVCEITEEGDSNVPFSKNLLRHLEESFGTEGQLESSLRIPCSQWSKFGLGGPELKDIICYICKIELHENGYEDGYFTMSLVHEPVSNVTYGVCLAQCSNPDFPRLILKLKAFPSWALHPHILPLLIAERAFQISQDRLDFTVNCLDHLEEVMGQHPYLKRPQGDPLSIDFGWATRVLNSTSTLLGSTTSRLEAIRALAEEIRLCRHGKYRPSIRDIDVQVSQSHTVFVRMEERCAYLNNICRNMLLRTDCEQKRTQTQLAVVYNYMAQKGNVISRDLAEDSKQIAIATKKDSSAMKTIALLTMIFLPATFVAALFAMPLFDWDAPRGHTILKRRFNYYWAATIPLTFVVIFLWTIFFLLPWRRWFPEQHTKLGGQTVDPDQSSTDFKSFPGIKYRIGVYSRSKLNLKRGASQPDSATDNERTAPRASNVSQDPKLPTSETKSILKISQKTIFEDRVRRSQTINSNSRRNYSIDRSGRRESIMSQTRLHYDRPVVTVENRNSVTREASHHGDTIIPMGSRRNSSVGRNSIEVVAGLRRDESRERRSYHLSRVEQELDYRFYGPIFNNGAT